MTGGFAAALEAVCFPHWEARPPGLDRTRRLTALLGEPQKKLRFVHITGTNGKGSTAAMLASILTAAGYRTGLFTSPHLTRYGERFRVDGTAASEDALTALLEKARPALAAMEEPPGEFELLTALGFLYFAERECDIVALEVGLGGRMDPTNVIDAPEAAVITNIGLEHTAILGDTVEKIAAEKAGIVKPGSAVVCYDGAPEAVEVIRRTCEARGASFRLADFSRITPLEHGLDGQMFRWDDGEAMTLSMPGAYQLRNAAVALETAEALRRRGWAVDGEALRRGLAAAVWPGRFEILCRRPLVIVDGAHNPNGVEVLAESLEQLLPRGGITFVMGVMADKDYLAMAGRMAPLAKRFIAVRPDSDRSLPAEALSAEITARFGVPARAAVSVEDGVRLALKGAADEDAVCVFGSLYQVGQVRAMFPERRPV